MVKLLDIKDKNLMWTWHLEKYLFIIDTQLILIELMSKTEPENEREFPIPRENQVMIKLPRKNAKNCRGNYYSIQGMKVYSEIFT